MSDSDDTEPYATDDPTDANASEQEGLALEAIKKFRLLGQSDDAADDGADAVTGS